MSAGLFETLHCFLSRLTGIIRVIDGALHVALFRRLLGLSQLLPSRRWAFRGTALAGRATPCFQIVPDLSQSLGKRLLAGYPPRLLRGLRVPFRAQCRLRGPQVFSLLRLGVAPRVCLRRALGQVPQCILDGPRRLPFGGIAFDRCLFRFLQRLRGRFGLRDGVFDGLLRFLARFPGTAGLRKSTVQIVGQGSGRGGSKRVLWMTRPCLRGISQGLLRRFLHGIFRLLERVRRFLAKLTFRRQQRRFPESTRCRLGHGRLQGRHLGVPMFLRRLHVPGRVDLLQARSRRFPRKLLRLLEIPHQGRPLRGFEKLFLGSRRFACRLAQIPDRLFHRFRQCLLLPLRGLFQERSGFARLGFAGHFRGLRIVPCPCGPDDLRRFFLQFPDRLPRRRMHVAVGGLVRGRQVPGDFQRFLPLFRIGDSQRGGGRMFGSFLVVLPRCRVLSQGQFHPRYRIRVLRQIPQSFQRIPNGPGQGRDLLVLALLRRFELLCHLCKRRLCRRGGIRHGVTQVLRRPRIVAGPCGVGGPFEVFPTPRRKLRRKRLGPVNRPGQGDRELFHACLFGVTEFLGCPADRFLFHSFRQRRRKPIHAFRRAVIVSPQGLAHGFLVAHCPGPYDCLESFLVQRHRG